MSANAKLIGNYAYSQYAFLNDAGFAMGIDSTPDAVTNGESTSAYLYDKAISLGGFTKTFDVIQGFGGGRIWARKVQGINDISNMPLQLSGWDATLESYWNNTAPDTTTSANNTVVAQNHENPNPPRFISVHSSELIEADGTSKWFNRFILNCQVTQPGGKTQGIQGGTNPNPLDYEVVPGRASRLPWGQLFSANANISTYNDADYEIIIESSYPLAITTYVDDGVGTASAFSLGYVPATTDLDDFFVFNQGVDDSANVTVSAAGSVSLTLANSAGDIMVIVYPTNFVAIA